MLDHQAIHQNIKVLVRPYVAKNIRSFNYKVVDFKAVANAFGFIPDLYPFEGKIVEYTNEAMVVKTGNKKFMIVDLSYVTNRPVTGTKVKITPYARRHFNGKRIDEPEVEHHTLNGIKYTSTRMILGGETTKLPIPEVLSCPELAAMVEQIQALPAPDGFRKVSHILVDAGATDFAVVDPIPSNIIKTPPALSFSVNNNKFNGKVIIQYERGGDYYTILLYQNSELVNRVEPLYFDDLGKCLVELIDDASWKKIEVETLVKEK